jgi:hypothetical protein
VHPNEDVVFFDPQPPQEFPGGLLLFRHNLQLRPAVKHRLANVFEEVQPAIRIMRPLKVRGSNVCEQGPSISEAISDAPLDTHYPKKKVFPDIRPASKPPIESPSSKRSEAPEKLQPMTRKVFPPAGHVLRPRDIHGNYFVDQTLSLQKRRHSWTCQHGDMSFWIVQSQILEERRKHRQVAEIPILDYQNAVRFLLNLAPLAVPRMDDQAEHALKQPAQSQSLPSEPSKTRACRRVSRVAIG